jgi:hypothetical protein
VGGILNETVKLVTGSAWLGPLSDYTANCRPVLSSERAPSRYKTANFRQQHFDRKYYLLASPTRVLDASTYSLTDWLTDSRKITSTTIVKVKVILQLTVSQSLCQGIEPILGLVTRYYCLFEGCFLKFAVLSLWGALSDERSGLSFVFLSLVICHYLHQTFTLHVFYSSAMYIQ